MACQNGIVIRWFVSALAAIAILAVVPSAYAATRYDPRLRFRTIRTQHFDIHAHQGEEALARRLAIVAEAVRARLEPELGAPRGRVQVILVNQADIANGWATPFPYDAIEIAALAPEPDSLIGNTTDWLELVFTHEYTHIVHLDRTRGVMRAVRGIFGRVPIAFPNVFTPEWQVEGLATFEESRQTGQGRVPAADFRSIVDVAARTGRFEPRDRANGGLVDWPSGHAAYAYGAYFHQFLAQRYGPERIAQLADATAGRVPYFSQGAFARVFGKPLDTLWNEFRASRDSVVALESRTDVAATRLTHHGFQVGALRVAGDGTVYYALTDARRFPALMALSRGQAPRRIAWRHLGNATSVRDDWIVFDQVRAVRSVALHSDLYAAHRNGSGLRRLTADARAADPDLSPDGRTIVCTIERDGRHAVAALDFSPSSPRREPRVVADEETSDYSSPRWSPDGRTIAASRRHAGAFELVTIDPTTGAVQSLLSLPGRRLMTPSWTPDGGTLLFAMDEPDRGVNVFALDVASRSVRRVTDSVTGARMPELSADGRALFYVGYSADGDDVFSVATDPGTWASVGFRLKAEATREPAEATREPADFRLKAEATREPAEATRVPAEEPRAYQPLRSLAPTYWTPVIASDSGEVLAGAATAMSDALGRHAYAAGAEWSASRARPDWHVSYAYDRWRPTLFATYGDDTDPVHGGEVRSREVQAGALLTFRQIRYSESFVGAFDAERDTLKCPAPCTARVTRADRRSARGGWLHDSRRAFGYSIGTEEGAWIETSVETSRVSANGDVTAGAGIVDLRAFQRLAGHTVIALRGAAALAWGDVNARRVFSAGGSGPATGPFDFGRDAIGLLRGFDPDAIVGTRAAVVNADLRFPLLRPQRGAGSWPAFVRALHGAVFVDAGHAWDARARLADARLSAGGELSLDAVLGFYLPVTFTAGAAWTRDPASPERARGAIFGRIGHAF